MFDLLPNEILCHIASYFDIKSNLNFGMTSKYHYDITNNFKFYMDQLQYDRSNIYLINMLSRANDHIDKYRNPQSDISESYKYLGKTLKPHILENMVISKFTFTQYDKIILLMKNMLPR